MRDFVLVTLILTLISLAMYGQRVNYSSFVVEYSDSLRVPLSVVWNLSSDDLGKVKRSSSMRFWTDTIAGKPTANTNDYINSGYDRGHMCPAADRSNSVARMRETFVMANICPQTPKLNRIVWKELEDRCRAMARSGLRLQIEACPVFWIAPIEKIGKNGVAVPHGFIKTIRLCDDNNIIYSKYFVNQ